MTKTLVFGLLSLSLFGCSQAPQSTEQSAVHEDYHYNVLDQKTHQLRTIEIADATDCEKNATDWDQCDVNHDKTVKKS
ncbi:hypothetical protein [Paraferrimonas haliotis]|uniref:Lipoprotein n=1 Tax=Paraferrimonas haliotis TaxID=2013866 RepID=A0AA37WZ52_9GAMM|nr:hypothetical protein [Paraferrimonas haliotis]GLS84470.1 hypothetical protein GCM10007894_24470 [Paraferrimonas haliotis]